MTVPLLLTTFAPWRAHQPSNASEDLLTALIRSQLLPPATLVLRQLPVSFELAPGRVIAKLVEWQPRVVVCCGMAETRTHLSLERQGKQGDRVLQTDLDLEGLMADTWLTEISTWAGDYVCNHLYYRVLETIHRHKWTTQALFIHIPRLTPVTVPLLINDLSLILNRLAALDQSHPPAAGGSTTPPIAGRTTRSPSPASRP